MPGSGPGEWPAGGDGGLIVRLDLVFPRFKLLSGAERLILGLAEALVERGHEPRIVCHRFDGSCRPRLAEGVVLSCTGKRLDWFGNRYLNAALDYGRTWQLSGRLDPAADARVLFGPALPLGWYRKRLRRDHTPFLYFCYEPPRALYQDRDLVLERVGLLRPVVAAGLGAYRWVDRRLVAAVDGVLSNSPFAAGRIEATYGRRPRVVTHGVDRERFDAAGSPGSGAEEPPEAMPPGGPPVFLTVNYLHPRKRVELALEALALLGPPDAPDPPGGPGTPRAPARPEATGATEEADRTGTRRGEDAPRLCVVGDGPERQALERRAAELGIEDRVIFTGFVADDDLPRYYWAATAYVHTALEESFGLSVIEAAYCARPVIAVDEGGVRETVEDGVTGLRVEPSAGGLAGGMERMLAAPDRGARMGEAGRQRVAARYDWQRGATDLLEAAREAGA